MAKFCTKCGKKLEEGKTCNCEAQKEEPVVEKKEEKKEGTTSSFDIQSCFDSYVEILKNIFTKPVTTIKKFATEENFILGLIAILINSLVTGILVYFIAKESLGSIMSGLGYSSLLFGMGSLEIPFIKIVLYGTIFMVVNFLMTSLMIFVLTGPLLKDNMNFKKSTALVGVCSIFTTVTTLVAIVLVLLSLQLAIYVILIAALIYFTYLYQGIVDTTKIDKNKLAYVFAGTIAVSFFVLFYILPKILF